MKFTRLIPIFATAALVVACESSSAPESGAVITGEVEETSGSPSSSMQPSYSLDGTSGSASAEASSVVAARVQSDGSLEVLSEAQVEAGGRYTLTGVPTGQRDLVVVARSSGGAEAGRVIVRERTSGVAEVQAAPINVRTTAEGLVYARLRASGMGASAISTAELALIVGMNASTAAHITASEQAVDAVAAAYIAAQQGMTRAFASAGSETSVSARADLLASAAAVRDRDLHSGMGISAAQEAFVEAALGAYIAAGVSAEALALATAAAASELDHALASANGSARLDIALQATTVNVAARKRLAAELPGDFGAFQDLAIISNIGSTLQIGAALGFSGFVTAVRDAEATAEAAVVGAIMNHYGDVSSTVRAEAEAHLEAAFVEATLSARIDASASAAEKAAAIEAYRQDVRAAVDVFLESLPTDVRLDAEATVELLVAVRGGPAFS